MSVDRASPPRAVTIGVVVAACAFIALAATMATVIVRQQSTPCPLCDVVDLGDSAAVQAALDGGAVLDDRAWQLAILAVANAPGRQSPMDVARVMVAAGADPNAWWSMPAPASRSAVSRQGGGLRASVVLAMAADTPVLVDALVARGLDITGGPGGEALVAAAGVAHLAVVERLLGAGAPVNYASQDDGLMPLAAAIQTRHLGVIAALEKAGGREW